jgi:hypothetical protein
MFQIKLPESRWKDIEAKIPSNIFKIHKQAVNINLPMVTMRDSIQKHRKSNIDVAIICFIDACETARDAIGALKYAHASLVWFYEYHPKAPQKYEAAHYGKFYSTDVTLRLYSAAEHVSSFIIEFLEISPKKFVQHKNRPSTQTKIGEYMVKHEPYHNITAAIQKLIEGRIWLDTMDYRNDWVHNQAPLIADTGIRLKRKSTVKESGNECSIPFGVYEEPKYTIEEFLYLITEASVRFVKFMSEMLSVLTEYIENLTYKHEPTPC